MRNSTIFVRESPAQESTGTKWDKKANMVSVTERLQYSPLEKPLPDRPHDATDTDKDPRPNWQDTKWAKAKFYKFAGLVITSVLSWILLASHSKGWTLSDRIYRLVNVERASVQLVVQIFSTIFGALQVTAICTLINFATRARLNRSVTSLDGFRFWFNLCVPHMEWTLPSKFFTPLLFFVLLSYIPSALWAGAISPTNVVITRQGYITTPQYKNISSIREYTSEYNTSVPQVRNSKGAFAYNVGIYLEGSLLFTAATATTIDGSPRQHRKLDNTGFTYIGRSYGVASSAGLSDGGISENPHALGYTYEELGYNTQVKCIYNSTSDFLLGSDGDTWIWAATGNLPNSLDGEPEFSVYTGRSTSSIVSIGVAHNQTNGTTKYMAIAAGENYASLNMTQCSINYVPTMFNISVSLTSSNITVTPLLPSLDDIEPTSTLRHVATRQLELISNDQTNLYQSLLGNSFLDSVGDYNISNSAPGGKPLTEADSTLAGLENAVTAMLDDIIAGYASAQLVVGEDFANKTVVVQLQAARLGEGVYTYSVFAVNVLILLLVTIEALRTRLWRDLVTFDYTDLRAVMIGSSQGGTGLAEKANAVGDGKATQESSFLRSWKETNGVSRVGQLRVRLEGTESALVAVSEKILWKS